MSATEGAVISNRGKCRRSSRITTARCPLLPYSVIFASTTDTVLINAFDVSWITFRNATRSGSSGPIATRADVSTASIAVNHAHPIRLVQTHRRDPEFDPTVQG